MSKKEPTGESDEYDVIIVGGSFAGLSSALTLGRSLRSVLVVDDNNPCNIQSPTAHNVFAHDGQRPADIIETALNQILEYKGVEFLDATVTEVKEEDGGFVVSVNDSKQYFCRKILFATGVVDDIPGIPGFAECWGISMLHCPYCHGYETRGKRTGLIANGESGYDVAMLLSIWTNDVVLLTNGDMDLTEEQREKLDRNNVMIDERLIDEIIQENGQMHSFRFVNGPPMDLSVAYSKPNTIQQSKLAARLGCTINEHGLIDVDEGQRTSIKGAYAAGDNCTRARSITLAVAAGTRAGFSMNVELLTESV